MLKYVSTFGYLLKMGKQESSGNSTFPIFTLWSKGGGWPPSFVCSYITKKKHTHLGDRLHLVNGLTTSIHLCDHFRTRMRMLLFSC